VLDYTRAYQLQFSPDGKKLVYVVRSYPLDWKPRVRILEVATGGVTEITPATKSERSPQWSPTGTTLAFVSNRGGEPQIYTMPDGGDATPLTKSKHGVSIFQWSPDGKAIAYLAKDDSIPSPEEPQLADDERVLEALWVVDVATKKCERIGTIGYRIDELAWRDRKHLLVAATNTPRVEEHTDAVYSISIPDGAVGLVSRPPQPFEGLMVSPDATELAMLSTSAQGPIARDLFVGTIDRDALRDLSSRLDRAIVQVRWHEQAVLWMGVADGFLTRLYKVSSGHEPQAVDLPLSVGSFDVAHDGTIAFAGGDFSHLQEIYLRSPDGHVRQVTHMQDARIARHLVPTTVFRTRSFDGTEVEAALVKPARADAQLPMVLLVHGGPSGRFFADYYWETAWAQLLASHGYEVLMVNPRGSTGYSEDFLKANRGDWGGGDFKDLMAVLDSVVAKGETDRNRIGIGGWSYGGEMSEWAITQTDRFRAAVVGAGVFDQQAEFETEDDPAGDEWYFGTPWEHPDVFARNSPSTYIRNAHTPTLIFDGVNDANNPVGQSTGLYRALKHFGVETELVIYPGEGHSVDKGAYNIDMFRRLLDWYDRHLGKKVVGVPASSVL
jgi:dipeptidyl aminopeptidase/acylaminoacyl peptidase